MGPQFRKYLIFIVVVGGFVGIDQVTKVWADHNLASDFHPLPLLVTDAMEGRTVGALLAARYPDLAQEAGIEETVRRRVTRARRDIPLDPDQNAFAPVQVGDRRLVPLAYLMFLDGLERAPRTIDLLPKSFARRWLSLLIDDRERGDTLLDEAFSEERLAAYLAEKHVRVDESDVRALIAKGHVMPLLSFQDTVEAGDPVQAGQLYLLHERKIDVIPGFFRFDYKENPGAAWGLFATKRAGFRHVFLTSISALASIVILVIFVRLAATHLSAIIAFSAILGGAVGNLIDRLRFNYVIDFLDMYVGTTHWPTYNVADIGITLGVIALVFEMLFVKSSPFAELGAEEKRAGEG